MFDKPLMIFDCDGVLIDSEVIYIQEEMAFLASKNVHVERNWFVQEFMALAEPLWRAKFSNLILEHTGTPLDMAEYTAMKATMRERVLNELVVIDRVENMLGALKVKACVASSTQMKFLPAKLARTNLSSYFGDHVYSGDQVENGKPAPDLFLFAARESGGVPDNAIVIEDSANGVKGAKAAGIFTIGFTGGSHCPDNHDETLIGAGADIVLPSHDALTQWLSENTKALA